MPSSIQCMETLDIVRARTVKCLIVSLSNGRALQDLPKP
jgi:hypothetical protein